jgi:LAO/AO transport system kinase
MVASVREGNRLSLARLLTLIENDTEEGQAMLAELFAYTGKAHLIGVTGAPGTGKSSLVNQLARHLRHPGDGTQPVRVGVIAVDPSSPFTGGAILGDRVRMRELAGDPGVFIRSMASRGSLGGLATATSGMVQALDAAGYELVLIETVGAGQAEVDIARLAHTTIVVEAPGMGDEIQAIKAGILEIADILVVNKADRPGVENTERALRSVLQLAHPASRRTWHHGLIEAVEEPAEFPSTSGSWQPPVLRAVSTEGIGIPAVAEAIESHRQYLIDSGDWQRRESARIESELNGLLRTTLVSRWRERVSNALYRQTLDSLIERRISPRQAVLELIDGSVQ